MESVSIWTILCSHCGCLKEIKDPWWRFETSRTNCQNKDDRRNTIIISRSYVESVDIKTRLHALQRNYCKTVGPTPTASLSIFFSVRKPEIRPFLCWPRLSVCVGRFVECDSGLWTDKDVTAVIFHNCFVFKAKTLATVVTTGQSDSKGFVKWNWIFTARHSTAACWR